MRGIGGPGTVPGMACCLLAPCQVTGNGRDSRGTVLDIEWGGINGQPAIASKTRSSGSDHYAWKIVGRHGDTTGGETTGEKHITVSRMSPHFSTISD